MKLPPPRSTESIVFFLWWAIVFVRNMPFGIKAKYIYIFKSTLVSPHNKLSLVHLGDWKYVQTHEIVVTCITLQVFARNCCISFSVAVNLLTASPLPLFFWSFHQCWRDAQFYLMSLLCQFFSMWWQSSLCSMVYLMAWKFFCIPQYWDPTDALEAL